MAFVAFARIAFGVALARIALGVAFVRIAFEVGEEGEFVEKMFAEMVEGVKFEGRG